MSQQRHRYRYWDRATIIVTKLERLKDKIIQTLKAYERKFCWVQLSSLATAVTKQVTQNINIDADRRQRQGCNWAFQIEKDGQTNGWTKDVVIIVVVAFPRNWNFLFFCIVQCVLQLKITFPGF